MEWTKIGCCDGCGSTAKYTMLLKYNKLSLCENCLLELGKSIIDIENKDISNDDRWVKESNVVKVVDKHTNDDGTLDDDISCVLEEIK